MQVRRSTALLIVVTGLATAACTASTSSGGSPKVSGAATGASTGTATAPSVTASSTAASTTASAPSTASSAASPTSSSSSAVATTATAATARQAKANELGSVPVLMYHRITATPGSDVYARTPQDFLAELTRLQAHGYVPITAGDLAAGHIAIPAGKHPVVLTFDDGTDGQFALDASGKVKPDTAIGILEAFAQAHPDFPAVATMYVNNPAFPATGTVKALQWLAAHDIEIGDHTVTHAQLNTLSDAAATKEIADDLADIVKAVPGYHVSTFALPFGIHPKTAALATQGSADGTSYHFAGVFLVGSDPAHSPFSKRFDASNIERIRSTSVQKGADKNFESDVELAGLYAHPENVFTSDGDPAAVSFPKSWKQYEGTLPAGMTAIAY